MSIKPRINWSFDGTILYDWLNTYTLSSEKSQELKNQINGDEFESAAYDTLNFGLAFQFPDLVQIHSIKFKTSVANIVRIYVSAEDTPNDWDPVNDAQWHLVVDSSHPGGYQFIEYAFSAIYDCKWMLINIAGNYVMSFQIFGEYITPRFEFWDVNETEELNTLHIPLVTPNAPNIQDFHEYLPFKLKNTAVDELAHDYSLTVRAVKYPTAGQGFNDPVITDNYKLGKSPSFAKSGTITLDDIPYGGFSEELRIFADVAKENNPADGEAHYFSIDGTETG